MLKQLREGGVIGAEDHVVVVSTAHGLKFTETKVAYHQSMLPDISSHAANPPRELEANLHVVLDALAEHFDWGEVK